MVGLTAVDLGWTCGLLYCIVWVSRAEAQGGRRRGAGPVLVFDKAVSQGSFSRKIRAVERVENETHTSAILGFHSGKSAVFGP